MLRGARMSKCLRGSLNASTAHCIHLYDADCHSQATSSIVDRMVKIVTERQVQRERWGTHVQE